jgi:REP element-mobilizing transposase RayT
MSHNQPLRLERIFQAYDPPLYFVTLCAAERRKIFNRNEVRDAFVNYCRRGLNRKITVGRYVLMPDHIHFFVQGDLSFDLGLWIRGLKRVVAAAVTGGRKQIDSASSQRSIWQRGFFDHIIRNAESYAQKWDYVRENPARAGLVKINEEWNFQGEIAVIDRV